MSKKKDQLKEYKSVIDKCETIWEPDVLTCEKHGDKTEYLTVFWYDDDITQMYCLDCIKELKSIGSKHPDD